MRLFGKKSPDRPIKISHELRDVTVFSIKDSKNDAQIKDLKHLKEIVRNAGASRAVIYLVDNGAVEIRYYGDLEPDPVYMKYNSEYDRIGIDVFYPRAGQKVTLRTDRISEEKMAVFTHELRQAEARAGLPVEPYRKPVPYPNNTPKEVPFVDHQARRLEAQRLPQPASQIKRTPMDGKRMAEGWEQQKKAEVQQQ